MDKRTLLSIVIPCFNEEQVLPLLRERLVKVMEGLSDDVEVLLVDDGSRDRTAELVSQICDEDTRFRGILLSRNYGHQIALTAGIEYAQGDVVAILDADLQDPPELLPLMLAKWRGGYDVVYGQRLQRQGDTVAKRATAAIFYWVMRKLSGLAIPGNVGDFRLMDRRVVNALIRMPERFRFIRGMVTWVGFSQTPIEFERPKRAAGETKYPWAKMLHFALDAILSFSVVPLRLSLYLGVGSTLLGAALILHTLYLRYWLNVTIPGFAATFVSVWLLGGLNLFFMGVFGEYLGRIYVEAKGRPLYFVRAFLAPEGHYAAGREADRSTRGTHGEES